MKQRDIIADAASQSVIIRIVDAADGTPEQAVEHNTAGVSLWYRREGATITAITPAALAALDTAYASGGIEHIDDGYYRLDVPDAAFVAGVDGVQIGGAFTDMIVMGCYIELQTPTAIDDLAAAVGRLSSGAAAINTFAEAADDGFVITEGASEANDEDSTHALDGTTHDIEDDSPNTDVYYVFDVGGNGVPVSVTWNGFANAQGDSYAVMAWNWTGTPAWEQIGTLTGLAATTVYERTFLLANAHVGTGANIGEVRIRFYSTDGTKLGTDRIIVSYSIVAESVGYSDGAIWVDSAGTAGSVNYVNGTADNPCPWANAKVIAGSLGIKRFHIANGNTVTLDATTQNSTLYGANWTLVLDSQDIAGSHFEGASVSGIGTGATKPDFHNCTFGITTLPPANFHMCGVGVGDGLFSGGSAGEYLFHNCFSVVAGSGTPDFNFAGNGASTGLNFRGWTGGAAFTLDSDCTLSHEVLAGGLQTFTPAGADVEIRGIMRAVTLVLTGAGTIQFVGITGPITLSGTTTAVVNLYGVASDIADTSVTAVVTNKTVSRENVNAEVVDALNVDTYGEPAQGAPAATTSLATKINWIYKVLRNKKLQTKTWWSLLNDDGATVDAKAAVSDDGTTFSKGEMETGP